MALLNGGMTRTEIECGAPISPDVFYRVSNGMGEIHADTEAKILALPVPRGVPRSGVYRDGTGTRRRLRALVVAGWTSKSLADRMGKSQQYVCYLLAGDGTGQVSLRVEGEVRRLFRELFAVDPVAAGVSPYWSAQARASARRKGWHPIAVWDDVEDPDAVPQYGGHTTRDAALVEDTAELAAQGLSKVLIAERLGVSWGYIATAHSRAGRKTPECRS